MKEIKGKTLVRIFIDSEVQMIRDELGGGTAYQTKQVGSLYVASSIKQENASAFDPISGEVALGEFKGMTAYFHKLCYREAKRYGNQNHLFEGKDINMPDGLYLQVEDESIFFYTEPTEIKDGQEYRISKRINNSDGTESIWIEPQIHMKPNWTLCEPITDWTYEYVDGVRVKARVSTGGILIPVTNEDYKTEKAILRHIHPKVSEELQLFAGDVVFLDKACDLPVEDELNMKLDKKYFRVEIQNILGVEPKEALTDKFKEVGDTTYKKWRQLQSNAIEAAKPYVDAQTDAIAKIHNILGKE